MSSHSSSPMELVDPDALNTNKSPLLEDDASRERYAPPPPVQVPSGSGEEGDSVLLLTPPNVPRTTGRTKSGSPMDLERNKVVYWIMVLMGVGVLLSWNVILNTLTYMKKASLKTGRDSTFDYEFIAPLVVIYPQLPLLAVMVKWGHKLSYTKRVVSTFLGQGILMALLPAVATVSVTLVLVIIFVIGLMTAVLQSSMFGFSSMFPPIFNQGFMAGQGVAGIVASVLRIVTKAAMNSDITGQAVLYYCLACAVMFLCVGAYLYLLKSDFAQHHMSVSATPRKKKSKCTPKTTPGGTVQSPMSALSDGSDPHGMLSVMSLRDMRPDAQKEDEAEQKEVSVAVVFKKIWLMCFVQFFIFFITFCVFPGETVDTKYHYTVSKTKIRFLGSSGWWPIILFLVFNIFDTLGRSLPGYCRIFSYNGLAVLTVLRIVLVPAMILCVRNDTTSPYDNDVFVLCLMVLFALSNGYCSSLGMMYGPSRVEPHERETAGLYLSFFLQFGISSGSTVALGVEHLN